MSQYTYSIPATDEQTFAIIAQECRLVCESINAELAGWDGTGDPIFDKDQVAFNNKDEIGDTFVVHRNSTETLTVDSTELPYDLAIRCCLCIMRKHFGDRMMLTSNLPERSIDWIQAEAFAETIRK